MCGLAGWFCFGDKRPEIAEIRNLWVDQLSRGKASAGAAYLSKDKEWEVLKEAIPVNEFAEKLSQDNWDTLHHSPIGLLHARATTKGTEKRNENNHPVIGLGWITTHNGTLTNDDELWDHFKDTKRVAEVDTSAINLVLSKGKSWVEAIGGIGTLTGTAALAAVHQASTDRVVLARWLDKPLHLTFSAERNILFWSSEGWPLPVDSFLAGLPARRTIVVPERTALLLSTKTGVQRYAITPSVYAKIRPVVSYSSGPIVTRSTADMVVFDERIVEGIPLPDFHGVAVDWNGPAPGIEKAKTYVHTGYGRWEIDGRGERTFCPTKKIKHYWKDVFGGSRVRLPASLADKEVMDGLGRLERVYLQRNHGKLYGLMCPWCGILETHQVWAMWHRKCPWCLIALEPAEGHVA